MSKGNELELEDSYPQIKKLKLLKGDAEIVLRFQGASINYDMTVESGDDIVDEKQQSIKRAGENTHAHGAVAANMDLMKGNMPNGGANGAHQMTAKSAMYICMQVFVTFIVILFVVV